MQTIYRTKAIRLDSGERFPVLVECDTELPVLDVVDFSLAYHRTKSINSSKSRVGAIGLFLERNPSHVYQCGIPLVAIF